MTGQEKDSSQTNSAVVADYKARTGKSAALFERGFERELKRRLDYFVKLRGKRQS